jgi:hypothetical protein
MKNNTIRVRVFTDRLQEARALVQRYHYAVRFPTAVKHVSCWALDEATPALAACVFSQPPTRWSENVGELSRLVRAENVSLPPLSSLVAAAVRNVKRNNIFDLVVSFADSTQGHHGGVYQACNWHYHGQRKAAMDGVIVGGVFYGGRAAVYKWGTRSPTKLQEMGVDATAHMDQGKHLYWLSLGAYGDQKADRLGLRKNKYIKPGAVR